MLVVGNRRLRFRGKTYERKKRVKSQERARVTDHRGGSKTCDHYVVT